MFATVEAVTSAVLSWVVRGPPSMSVTGVFPLAVQFTGAVPAGAVPAGVDQLAGGIPIYGAYGSSTLEGCWLSCSNVIVPPSSWPRSGSGVSVVNVFAVPIVSRSLLPALMMSEVGYISTLYSVASFGVTACWLSFVYGCHGRIIRCFGPYVDSAGSTARWLASRKPAVIWLDAPDGSTSLRTAMSVASVALSFAHRLAVICPVIFVSACIAGVV